MKLYFANGTVAQASLIALCEIGVEFELKRLDYAIKEQQSAAYRQVNPKARVPSLIVGERVLTETPAILHYLATAYPKAKLIPQDPWDQSRVHELVSYLASTMHVAHAHKMRGPRWARHESSFDDMRTKVTENMADCCAYLEATYFADRWALESGYSIADIHLFSVAQWLAGDGVVIAEYPKLSRCLDLIHARPAVKRALTLEAGA